MKKQLIEQFYPSKLNDFDIFFKKTNTTKTVSVRNRQRCEGVTKLTTKKSLGPSDFTAGFYQTFKEELLLIPHKVFQKIECGGTPSNSFYKACITLILKPDKVITRKLQHYKYEHKNTSKPNSTAYKKISTS